MVQITALEHARVVGINGFGGGQCCGADSSQDQVCGIAVLEYPLGAMIAGDEQDGATDFSDGRNRLNRDCLVVRADEYFVNVLHSALGTSPPQKVVAD